MREKGFQIWLPYYLFRTLLCTEKINRSEPIHLFLCIVDHFEPFNGGVDSSAALERVKFWRMQYPAFSNSLQDADGKPIQHTWFYPPHLDHSFLPYLVELCQKGYGDIEMHMHHNHMDPFPDTSETLRDKVLKCIDDYGNYGIFVQEAGLPRFGFIHGDWSLDNSGGDHLCGVNNELTILRECGCYADFTFPCLNRSQPAMVNSIYYAFDDPGKPKSYNWGLPAKRGMEEPLLALLIIQGILGIRPSENKKIRLAVESSNLGTSDPPTAARVDYWVKNAISIKGRPNWKFIKLHTHGAPESMWAANLGEDAKKAFTYLERVYNDGKEYVLHYVTAREMYNIIQCAISGSHLIPSKARDYIISPYPYTT